MKIAKDFFPSGCFVYIVFGSCKDITIGVTGIMALMTYPAVANYGPEFAVLLTFLIGCVIFLLGILNLGFLVQFISTPTISAFITAAAVIIGSGQVKNLLGIKSGSSSEFIPAWTNVIQNYHEIRWSDTLLGLFSLAFLIGMKQVNQVKVWPKFFKFLSISRNALVVIIGIMIAYVFYQNGSQPFRLTGDIKRGLPNFALPPFSAEANNRTYNFIEMSNSLGLSLVTVPLIAILEAIAIAKAFSKGKVVDASQEMIALGLVNILSSFVSSIPITASLTRTAVNNASGVKTQLGGAFTGALVLLALGLLTGTFYFIPKTVLAAVILVAMYQMIEIHEILTIYRTKKSDIIPLTVTFAFSLWLGLEFGILIGIGVNMIFTIYSTSRPKIRFEIDKVNDQEILVVTPNQSLIYSSAEYFKTFLYKKTTEEFSDIQVIVLNGTAISSIDATVAKVNKSLF